MIGNLSMKPVKQQVKIFVDKKDKKIDTSKQKKLDIKKKVI